MFLVFTKGQIDSLLYESGNALGHLGVGGEIHQNTQRFAHHTSPNLPEKAVKFSVTG